MNTVSVAATGDAVKLAARYLASRELECAKNALSKLSRLSECETTFAGSLFVIFRARVGVTGAAGFHAIVWTIGTVGETEPLPTLLGKLLDAITGAGLAA